MRVAGVVQKHAVSALESVHARDISKGYLIAIYPLGCGGKFIRATIKQSQKENIQSRQR